MALCLLQAYMTLGSVKVNRPLCRLATASDTDYLPAPKSKSNFQILRSLVDLDKDLAKYDSLKKKGNFISPGFGWKDQP